MSAKAPRAVTFEEPTTASLHFFEKGKVQPIGYDGLGINEEVTVILKGKVRKLGTSSWEGGKSLEIELSACEISKAAEPTGIDGAIKAADKARKKV